MPNVEWYRRARLYLGRLLMGVLLGLYGSATAFAAFVPSDSPLLTVGSVTPNVMLLVDDSGSMNSIIWASGFDPNANPVQVYSCNSDFNCNNVTSLDMTDTNFFVGNLRAGGCDNGYDGFYKFTTRTLVCLKLPDPVGNGNTRYTTAYISYLLYGTSLTKKDYTDGSVPNDYRINVARTASAALVASNRNLRIGLATFNPPTSRDSGPGGNIARAISDLTQTTSTTTAQANTNYNSLISSINGLAAIANTPLAKTYYEVTRYFRGMAPYYNSTPTTYTSPIQYRCQRNYGVVITDGLPTYDRTFPTNDPLGGANLPNWDGKNNDGDNLNGDGEGDTLYLDDMAKFAYDIDMRTGGTDAAGKSWDATDFPTQNMFTYTVGFTAANAMLSDAAAYGKGTYYQATDSAGLNAALSAALNDITSRAGTGGGAASNSSSLSSTSVFFQTQYDPTDWRGTIKALAIAADGSVNTSSPIWSTDDQIIPGITPTYESWNTLTNSVIALTYASFSPQQQVALNASLPVGVSGADLVQWTKGTNKTGLKTRTVLLGDVINSPLAYASPTDNPASDPVADNSYSTYVDIKSNSMSPRLVVNANDGLVNVIDPSTGKRLYAYMPSTVLANLHYVADPSYINGVSHKFLVDGQISIVDVQYASSWKTLAIGGTGAGGKGFYALQMFNAGASNTVKALWDISSVTAGFGNMGYAYAKPEVAQLPDGRWAAFISNGYGSTNGVASLFVVDVSTGALIKEIPVDTSGNNGLSSVKLRVNAASVVQYAYGGDLKGQMWKFDFTSQAAPTGKVGLGGSPLFTASGGANQPITAQPVVGNNPNGGKMVYFGTGKLMEASDKTMTATQAFYAVWDNDGTSANYHESDLVAQAINGTYNASSVQFFTTTQNDVNYAAKKGFYLPLIYNNIATGERVIYAANLGFGRVRFATAIVDTTDPCSSSGSSRFVDLDALNGRMLSYPVLDTNGDGQINSSDSNSSGFLVSGGVLNPGVVLDKDNGNQEFVSNSNTFNEAGGPSNRRIMWRQIR
ncbi:PilC/PilY family type IV pilus protein [Pseudomonas sp. KU26590]|uniref:pilus assembly protein n=1 Tax=Pseudomonas sp. KU26590 TaxID=2991051 RepID=UPI00223E1B0F|nr:PilC/PilY family type IV pilus protein [Pseudomonas sp. KU26590]UZJ59916.1 PilC/PilY family type IV pilus protein [Pseudomonas sp. KU26590]